jgi:VIT1/CCC1 family predicted Fe2+/Mn2+ transporter
MFVGAVLSSRSRKNLILRERAREEREIVEKPEEEREEVRQIFHQRGFSESETDILVRGVCSDPKLWVDLMMRDELGLPPEADPQPFTHGAVIGLAYLLGGILPALPFLFIVNVRTGLWAALAVGGLQLATIGLLEARYAGTSRLRGAGEILLIGLATAFAVFLVTTSLQSLPG